ncbi:hypothetical protein [Pseudaminobacter soli (ex Li et al. 2025)]|uniref:hypothetical protein n=1 Tax=Pseudaminobacter soli (ex Li et al. 2025) TaxID=1295366 RepID=UPI0024754AB6|nr:hypothetical protein [Mesorhizobium soli]
MAVAASMAVGMFVRMIMAAPMSMIVRMVMFVAVPFVIVPFMVVLMLMAASMAMAMLMRMIVAVRLVIVPVLRRCRFFGMVVATAGGIELDEFGVFPDGHGLLLFVPDRRNTSSN